MAQVVKCLLSMHETLVLIPSTEKKSKQANKQTNKINKRLKTEKQFHKVVFVIYFLSLDNKDNSYRGYVTCLRPLSL
jgi:hypothetical protein